jgi:hypothetical protein
MMIGGRILDLKAAESNGTDEYAYVDNPSFKADHAGAFSIWYRPTTVLGVDGIKSIIGYGVKSAGNNSYLIIGHRWNSSAGSAPRICVGTRRSNGGLVSDTVGTTSVVAGTLYHIVVQCDGSAWAIYLNGSSLALSTWLSADGVGHWLGDITGTDHRLSFASRTTANVQGQFSDHKANEISYVSGRVLTAGEITSLYNSGTPLGYRQARALIGADLVSHWSMFDRGDSASQIVDRFGNNHLSLMNMDITNAVTP